ncbi:MAG: hypothetical protein HGB19_01945 [Chlorobiales bacterium]|jgi:hypothetical protein|nr:hypothetical protein [Chlorobiales bacterium]
MTKQQIIQKDTIWVWILVTLMWGSIFHFTSIYALKLASARIGGGSFNPGWEEIFSVYGLFVGVMLATAFVSRFVNHQLDPTGEKRLRRQQAVAEGNREKLFVSFAGSLATSFGFGFLTAGTYLAASSLFGVAANFTLPVVVLASLGNVVAGLIGSVVVGVVFLTLKQMGKFPQTERG